MLRTSRTTGINQVRYYRRGSAGSHFSVRDVPQEAITGSRLLHVSGITAAISGSARQAVAHAVRLARTSGVQVSFDVNYRSRLTTTTEAASFLAGIIDQIDVLFCGDDELDVLASATSGSNPVQAALDAGVSELVLKRGELGAKVHTRESTFEQPAQQVAVADTVGAGDAFAAGYLSGCLDGEEPDGRLARAITVAAFCVSSNGDWEGLPTRGELTSIDPASTTTVR